MNLQLSSFCEIFSPNLTFAFFLLFVIPNVNLQLRRFLEGFNTKVTFILVFPVWIHLRPDMLELQLAFPHYYGSSMPCPCGEDFNWQVHSFGPFGAILVRGLIDCKLFVTVLFALDSTLDVAIQPEIESAIKPSEFV